MVTPLTGRALACAGLALIAACGSSSITSSGTPFREAIAGDGPILPPIVTIRASGPEPQVLHLYGDRKVTFINEDLRPHSVFGDVHPSHLGGACPELNVGSLAPGEHREVVWTHARYVICYFHDEVAPLQQASQGVVVVH